MNYTINGNFISNKIIENYDEDITGSTLIRIIIYYYDKNNQEIIYKDYIEDNKEYKLLNNLYFYGYEISSAEFSGDILLYYNNTENIWIYQKIDEQYICNEYLNFNINSNAWFNNDNNSVNISWTVSNIENSNCYTSNYPNLLLYDSYYNTKYNTQNINNGIKINYSNSNSNTLYKLNNDELFITNNSYIIRLTKHDYLDKEYSDKINSNCIIESFVNGENILEEEHILEEENIIKYDENKEIFKLFNNFNLNTYSKFYTNFDVIDEEIINNIISTFTFRIDFPMLCFIKRIILQRNSINYAPKKIVLKKIDFRNNKKIIICDKTHICISDWNNVYPLRWEISSDNCFILETDINNKLYNYFDNYSYSYEIDIIVLGTKLELKNIEFDLRLPYIKLVNYDIIITEYFSKLMSINIDNLLLNHVIYNLKKIIYELYENGNSINDNSINDDNIDNSISNLIVDITNKNTNNNLDMIIFNLNYYISKLKTINL